MIELIQLSELATRLIQAGYISPPYIQLYHSVIDGHLAAFASRERGRWFFDAADLPKIAERLELRRAVRS